MDVYGSPDSLDLIEVAGQEGILFLNSTLCIQCISEGRHLSCVLGRWEQHTVMREVLWCVANAFISSLPTLGFQAVVCLRLLVFGVGVVSISEMECWIEVLDPSLPGYANTF